MHFDIKDLKLFLAISEEGSLTRGAEKTYMSAASGSVRIRNLEQSINLRLLYRSSKSGHWYNASLCCIPFASVA